MRIRMRNDVEQSLFFFYSKTAAAAVAGEVNESESLEARSLVGSELSRLLSASSTRAAALYISILLLLLFTREILIIYRRTL